MTKWETQPSARMDRSLVLCCSHSWLWTAAGWEKSSQAGWSPEQVSLVPLWGELYVQLSFPPPFWHNSRYYFFVKSSGRFSELRQHAAYFRGKENNCICRQADLHYLNIARSVPLSFRVYKWMKVLWQLRNYCKINSSDAHIFVCSYILSKPNGRKKYLWFR